MDPVDVRTAPVVGGRTGTAEDHHRDPVNVRVVDPHRAMQEAHDVVQDHSHRLAGRLRVPVGQPDRDLLVRAAEHLHLVARVIDE